MREMIDDNWFKVETGTAVVIDGKYSVCIEITTGRALTIQETTDVRNAIRGVLEKGEKLPSY